MIATPLSSLFSLLVFLPFEWQVGFAFISSGKGVVAEKITTAEKMVVFFIRIFSYVIFSDLYCTVQGCAKACAPCQIWIGLWTTPFTRSDLFHMIFIILFLKGLCHETFFKATSYWPGLEEESVLFFLN
jgi:hypothetical protein